MNYVIYFDWFKVPHLSIFKKVTIILSTKNKQYNIEAIK